MASQDHRTYVYVGLAGEGANIGDGGIYRWADGEENGPRAVASSDWVSSFQPSMPRAGGDASFSTGDDDAPSEVVARRAARISLMGAMSCSLSV